MENQIQQVFAKYDTNKDGSLDREEAKGLISQVCYVMRKNGKDVKDNDKMIQEMFDRVDINKDGQITLDELQQAFKKYRDQIYQFKINSYQICDHAIQNKVIVLLFYPQILNIYQISIFDQEFHQNELVYNFQFLISIFLKQIFQALELYLKFKFHFIIYLGLNFLSFKNFKINSLSNFIFKIFIIPQREFLQFKKHHL